MIRKMSIIDYEMAEYTAELVSEYLQRNEPIPNYIFQNFLMSTICLTLNHEGFGPSVEKLYHDLEAAYRYSDANELEGFDVGAVYGATQFYKEFQEIKEINEGRTK